MDDPETAEALEGLASLRRRQDRTEEAEQMQWWALAINERAHGPGREETASSLSLTGMDCEMNGRHRVAEVLYARALGFWQKREGSRDIERALTREGLARTCADQGKLDDAEGFFKRAVAIREQAQGRDHPATVNALDDLAKLRTGGRHKWTTSW